MKLDLLLSKGPESNLNLKADILDFLLSPSLTKRCDCSIRLKSLIIKAILPDLNEKELVSLASDVSITFPDTVTMKNLQEENKKLSQYDFLRFILSKRSDLVDVSLIIQ